MLSKVLRSTRLAPGVRAFSSTPRALDLSKLMLIGHLGAEPELRLTQSNKEFVSYIVGTRVAGYTTSDGTRQDARTQWHKVLCFNPATFPFLRSLGKGSQVYVEANYAVSEPNREAVVGSPESMRQIFLRHEQLRVLRQPRPKTELEGEATGQP